MVNQRTGLSDPWQPERSRPSWRERWRSVTSKPAVLVITWLVLWIPVSFLFPFYHADLPVPPLFMPAFFVGLLGEQIFDWMSVGAPAAVFWGGVAAALIIGRRRARSWRRRNDD